MCVSKILTTQPNGKELAQIESIIEEGKTKPVVTTILPLEDAKRLMR